MLAAFELDALESVPANVATTIAYLGSIGVSSWQSDMVRAQPSAQRHQAELPETLAKTGKRRV